MKNKDLISLNIIGSIGNTIYVEDIVVRVDNSSAIGGEVSIKQELIENNWARYSKSGEDNVRNQLEFIAPKTKLWFQTLSDLLSDLPVIVAADNLKSFQA